jgi:hypothetical protein
MSKHIITAMRSLTPYLQNEEIATPTTGLAGRITPSPVNKTKVDPKQTIANYVKVIRNQRNTYGE